MEIRYYGHATCEVMTGDHHIWIDPFLSDNPLLQDQSLQPFDLDALKVDAVILTHAHSDHTGDALTLARTHDAPIIATFELAQYFAQQGAKAHPMNLGGSYVFPFGKVRLVPAFHSSSLASQHGDPVYLGMPAGVVLTTETGTLYHAGDTALFTDMKLIGELYQPDVALLPIGDNFTMGPEEALIAAKWVQAPYVIPIHYNTFPVIKQDVTLFTEQLKEQGITGVPLKVGESFHLPVRA